MEYTEQDLAFMAKHDRFMEEYSLSDLTYDGEDLGFEWRRCPICDGLAGNRTTVAGLVWVNGQLELVDKWGVCDDCVCYIANGEVPNDYDREQVTL